MTELDAPINIFERPIPLNNNAKISNFNVSMSEFDDLLSSQQALTRHGDFSSMLLASQSSEITKLQRQRTSINLALSAEKKRSASLEAELSEANDMIAKLKSSSKKSNREIEQTRREQSTQRDKLMSNIASVEAEKQQIFEQLNMQIDSLTADRQRMLDDFKVCIDSEKHKARESNERVCSLEEELSSLISQSNHNNDEFGRTIKALSNEKQTLNKSIIELKKKQNELQKQNTELKIMVDDLNLQLASQHEQHSTAWQELNAEKVSLQHEKFQLQLLNDTHTEALEASKSTIDQLTIDISLLGDDLKRQKESTDAANAKRKIKEDEIKALNNNVLQLQEELKMAHQASNRKQTKIDQYKQEVQRLQAHFVFFESTLQSLATRVGNNKKQTTTLKKQLAESNDALVVANREIACLQEQHTLHSSMYQKQLESLKARNQLLVSRVVESVQQYEPQLPLSSNIIDEVADDSSLSDPDEFVRTQELAIRMDQESTGQQRKELQAMQRNFENEESDRFEDQQIEEWLVEEKKEVSKVNKARDLLADFKSRNSSFTSKLASI